MDFMCGATARGYMYAAEWYGTLRPHFQVFIQMMSAQQQMCYMLQTQVGMHVHKCTALRDTLNCAAYLYVQVTCD